MRALSPLPLIFKVESEMFSCYTARSSSRAGDEWWGVGQASAIAVNGTQILLTYTRGNGSAFNGQMRTVLDFADVSQPVVVLPERRITEHGLTLADGSQGSGGFVNAAMVYDPFNERFWTLREGKPMPPPQMGGDFCVVSSSVQLAWIPAAAILPSVETRSGLRNHTGHSNGARPDSLTAAPTPRDPDGYTWTVEQYGQNVAIASVLANRTHNPGFVSDIFGYRNRPDMLDGMVTSMGEEGPLCLFTYKPFSVTWRASQGGT